MDFEIHPSIMAVPFIRLLTFSIGVFIYSLHGQPLDQDGFCPPSAPVLCVREVLMAITAMTKNINRTLNQIENDILENVQITETLNRYVQYELNLIYFRLPTPQLHMQFFQMNNIDEVGLAPNSLIFILVFLSRLEILS